MEGREGRDPGYDDWFDEPEPPTETQSGVYRGAYDDAEDDWVLPGEEDTGSGGRREIVVAGRTLTMTQVAIIAASVIVLIIAVLAAAGAFNGSKAPVPPVTTPPTNPPKTATTQTQTATTPTVTAPSQTLSPGATGDQVKVLQQALNSLGFSTGKPDGVYGPATQTAVEQFQASKGLAEDGVVGQQTLAALQQALSG